jgi:mono/diheme cytochrome c family protein
MRDPRSLFRLSALAVLVPLLGLSPGRAAAAEPAPDFATAIKPILEERCFECHSHAARKMKAGLALDSRAGLLAGGDSGPAMVPGDADKSRIIQAIRYTDEDLQMPPKNKRLGADQVALLTAWVQAGAPWPESPDAPGAAAGSAEKRITRAPGGITDEDRRWWAFQPVADPVPPAAAGWGTNPIDAFVLERLRRAGLEPAPPATPEQLVRRVTYDLTGLPPAPEEVAAFAADPSPQAWAALVDRLLASPRYGEHWARHWLDLVRYAESDGYRIDDYRPQAWRYRDYVIAALNDDKPYDRFVQEQLAGDELFPDEPQALVATGYLRHWVYEYNNRDVAGQRTAILNDLTDVTADVFMGLGVQCARCHDHKFDPILQKDYFRLQAFFAPLVPRDDLPVATAAQVAAHQRACAAWADRTAAVRARIAALEAPYRVKAERVAVIKFPPETQEIWRKPAAARSPLEGIYADLVQRQVLYEFGRLLNYVSGEDKPKLIALQQELNALEQGKPAPLPAALAASDIGPAAPPVLIPKKERLGEIAPGFPTILEAGPAALPPPGERTTNRRSALARWLTRADNPLTARVIVNRVWQCHFGRGLVATSSDFGHLGEPPSHPELLDWLTRRFVASGWSLKQLHRLILLSSTWRQSAFPPEARAGQLKDPENRLLWRGTTRRLEAEAIRDTVLRVTGELDLAAGGPGSDGSACRRSIYGKVLRNAPDPALAVFDAADGFGSLAQRNTTTTPRQSLFMLDSDWSFARARAFARRLAHDEPASDPGPRIARALALAFARRSSAAEVEALTAFLGARAPGAGPAAAAAGASQKLPLRDGRGALLAPGTPQERLLLADSATLPPGDFTIEAFVLLRSVYDSGEVRTIAARWDGDLRHAGWSFGVTGRKSRFKPETLVLQLARGDGADKEAEPVFSGLTVQVGRPYYVAVSVHVGDGGGEGITFYAKDLSNDDVPLLHAGVPHRTTATAPFAGPFAIGGRSVGRNQWDGVIDDVRLSAGALRAEELLLTTEGTAESTLGYWRFEPQSGPYRDSSANHRDLQPRVEEPAKDPGDAAWVDLCHALLNASELLYID